MNFNPRPYFRPITVSDIWNPQIEIFIPKISYKKKIRKQIDSIRDYIKFCEEQVNNFDLPYYNRKYYKTEFLRAVRSLKIYYKQASILAA